MLLAVLGEVGVRGEEAALARHVDGRRVVEAPGRPTGQRHDARDVACGMMERDALGRGSHDDRDWMPCAGRAIAINWYPREAQSVLTIEGLKSSPTADLCLKMAFLKNMLVDFLA